MKQFYVINWLIPLIAILAAVAALVGLFAQVGDGRSTFTTLHGQTVEIYGKGLYRFDTVFSAATFKGVDVITLIISLPLLITAFVFYRRNSLRGGILLLSALPYFIYIGASMTFSAAFNRIFLLYVALFSSSLVTFIGLATSINLELVKTYVARSAPSWNCYLYVRGRNRDTYPLAQRVDRSNDEGVNTHKPRTLYDYVYPRF